MTEYVYFLQDSRGRTKIGRTSDVHRRIASMQTAHPEPLHLVGHFAGGADLEKRLHDRFSLCRLGGEWFNLTRDDVRSLFMEGLESNLPSPAPKLGPDYLTVRATGWANYLIRRYAKRYSVSHADARVIVANRAGALNGTLENLQKGRIEAISAELHDALLKLKLEEADVELAELRKLHAQVSGKLSRDKSDEIETHLEAVKALLNSGRAAE